jgi:DNA-binding NarL/FixJ family response regulator
VGAQGYLLKTSEGNELLDAIRAVSSGGTFITREISDRIARHVARNGGQQAFTQLSEREFQVLRGLALGKSCKELAEEFNLSVKTIYTYRTRLLEKLELKNDIDLLRYVLRHNLLSGDDEPHPIQQG